MKRFVAGIMTIGAAFAAGASEYFVDAAAPAGGDGTQARPFATIQAAVDVAAANDVIRVAAGTYASGGTLSGACGSRVRIDGKPGLRLVGAGRGKSLVVGSRDPSAEGYSVAATNTLSGVVRCLHVTASAGAVISGFTLRDGETLDDGKDESADNCGGAVYADSTDVTVVDCDLVHASARYGAATYRATLVRCVADDCYGMRGPGGAGCRMVNSVVSRPKQSGSNVGAVYGSRLYNTTIGDSGCFWALQGKSKAWNTLFVTYSNNTILQRECYDEDNSEVVDSVRPTVAAKNHWQVLGPAVGDWRLLDDSDAIGAGDPNWLKGLSLPEGVDAFTDLLGAAIVTNAAGRVNAGAVQAAVTPAGGALVFNKVVEIGGRKTRNRFLTWVYPSVYPAQYCVKAVLGAGEHLYRLARLDPATGSVADGLPSMVPSEDGTMWLMPPPDASVRITNRFDLASAVLWVDPENGTAAGDGTEENPFDTLPKAAGQLVKSQYSVIYLKPGEYTNAVVAEANGRGNFRMVFTDKKYYVRVVSTDGAAKTIIRGAPDPDTGEKGANAIKGICLTGFNQIVQGVTFADCYSDTGSDGSSPYGAAAYPYGSNRPIFADCVITNCHASRGVIANPAVLYRCRAYDSTASGKSPFNGGAAFACYTRGVTCTASGSSSMGIFGNSAVVYQSTLTTELGVGRLTGSGNVSYNSIWYGGKNIYTTSVFTNCFVYKPKDDAQGTYEKTDPQFVDVTASGELLASSPAIGAGGAMTVEGVGADYWRYACGDIDGRPIRFNANGRATLGAFQTGGVKVVDVDEPAEVGWRIKGGTYGTRQVREGETFTAEVEFVRGSRPCVGVTCSGRTYSFTNATTVQVTIPYDELDAASELRGIYTTDWYVDDDGDDAHHGFWPGAAKKTLCTAAAAIAAGDTLHVLPGVYSNGTVRLSEDSATLIRVRVAAGASVVSTDGPEKTFILGAGSPDANADPETGCGTNAVRCAYVGAGGVLSGFTLAGGRVNLSESKDFPYDGYGSAVLGAGRGEATVANCVISNGYARLGSVAMCDAVTCRFVGNVTTSHGSGVRQGNAYGCLFDGNVGAVIISYPNQVWNCTLLRSNLESGSSTKIARCVDNPMKGFSVFNCFFGGRLMATSTSNLGCISNVIASTDSSVDEHNMVGNFLLCDTSSYAFDAQGIPVIGGNAVVDAGFVLVNTNGLGTVDVYGNPRVQNGRMDIGCCEADWKDEYARRIGRPDWFSVTDVSTATQTNGAGQVCLLSGGFASQVLNPNGEATFSARVEIVGAGVLQVLVNDSVVATRDTPGTYEIPFAAPQDVNRLVFAFTPASDASGEVKILSVRRHRGLLLFIK